MSDPYRTPPEKPVPSFSLLAFLQQWFEPARLVILLCGGVLALLDIVSFGIVIFFSALELIFQIRLKILNNYRETQSNIFSLIFFIGLLVASFLIKTVTAKIARAERDRQAEEAERTARRERYAERRERYADRLSLCIRSKCLEMGYDTNDIKDLPICIHNKCMLVDKDVK